MPDACCHLAGSKPAASVVAAGLARAEARCVDAGERWTPARRRTYQLLIEAGRPMKAYDLIGVFGPGRAPAKPPTVYRSLEFLEGLGLVHRLASLSAFVACAGGSRRHQAEFLICDCCGRVDEAELGALEIAETLAGRADFRLHRVLLEAHGLCAACRTPARGPNQA